MGVLPLQFASGVTRRSLALTGAEIVDSVGLDAGLTPRMMLTTCLHRPDGTQEDVPLICRVGTPREVQWIQHGGILPYAARLLVGTDDAANC
jgi:aconitate hydratase